MFADAATDEFFRARLNHMIDLRHSLAVLACRMPWQQIEASVAHLFSLNNVTSSIHSPLPPATIVVAERSR